MTDMVYCDICREYDARVPATMAFYVQREDDATAPPPSVRCCDPHEGLAAIAAAPCAATWRRRPCFVSRSAVVLGGNPHYNWPPSRPSARSLTMEKRGAVGVMTLLLLAALPGAGAAWNRAGHMVSGAIAYSELTQASATALARAVELLKAHPYFPTKWTAEITKPFVPPEERDLYLLMLAARWPDDIRDTQRFDRPPWHYINHLFAARGRACHGAAGRSRCSAHPQRLRDEPRHSPERGPEQRARVALAGSCISSAMSTSRCTPSRSSLTQFPAPQGDRGGTRFFIRVRKGGARLVSTSSGMTWCWAPAAFRRTQYRNGTAAAAGTCPGTARRACPTAV